MSEWLDAEGHADRALEMYERGRWAEAEAELRKALALNPDHADWHYNLGLTLEAAGRELEAVASYQQAMELAPDLPEPRLAAGVVANRLGDHERAVRCLDAALKLNPTLEVAYAHKIEALIRLGRHDEAETNFYLAQQALPEPSPQCLAVIGESLMERGLFERSEWCLKEALRMEPSMPRLRARLAAVSAALGKPQRAMQLYLRELRDDPGNIDTLLDYAELLRNLGRLPESAEKLRRVLELEPANIEAHFQLGLIALAGRRFEKAHLEFELVFKLDPQFPGIRPALAEALLRRGRDEDARKHLLDEFDWLRSESAAVEIKLQAAPSQQGLPEGGSAPMPRMQIERARADLARLSDLLLEAGEPAKAAELFEHALSAGQTADLLRRLALARFRCGDLAAGAAASREVLRLEPNCVRSIHNLALAALEQHQPRVAAGWVRSGLNIDPHDVGLRRLRVRVWIETVREAIHGAAATVRDAFKRDRNR